MLALFTGVAGVLMDGGFSAALIQRQDVSHTDESTVFWCNLGIGAVLTLGLCVAAPAIASFFAAPVLAPLTRVTALVVLFGALGAIHSTLLIKQLDFRTNAKASLGAALLSGTTAIFMAWLGCGVWALATQAVVMAAAMSALLWLMNPWRPAWVFSPASMRKLFAFGGYHLGSSLMEMAYGRLYTLLIGRQFGARDLGLYHNAEMVRQVPIGIFGGLLARVALPMYSEAAQDTAILRRGVQLSIRGTMLISVPMMLAMAALAEPLIAVVFGDRWLPAAPILQVLCVAGVLYPLHAINLHVLMARGHARSMFRLELIKKTFGVALLAAGAFYGVMGVAWSQLVFSFLVLVINAHYTKRWLGYGAINQLREIAPAAISASLVAILVAAVSRAWDAVPLLELGVLGGAGVLAYLAVIAVARVHALQEMLDLFRNKQPRHSP